MRCHRLRTAASLILLLLPIGCGKEPAGQPAGAGAEEEEKLTSLELIDRDLEAGRLTWEEALLYKAYSLYFHPDLPAKYRSEEMPFEGTAVFSEISLNWEKLSPAVQEKLGPFYANPVSAESVLNQPWQQRAGWQITPAAEAAEPDCDCPPPVAGLKSHLTADQRVRIWYRPGDESRADTVLKAFDEDRLIQRLEMELGMSPLPDEKTFDGLYCICGSGIDYRIDVYFGNLGASAVANHPPLPTLRERGSRQTWGWIVLGRKLQGLELKAVVAHELFHLAQFAMDIYEPRWFKESTASWSVEFFYRTSHLEHRWWLEHEKYSYFVASFMQRSLFLENQQHEYTAYLFPFYLAKRYGNQIIGKIWQQAIGKPVKGIHAFEAEVPGGVDANFKEFAKWVYNEEPARHFTDSPPFPDRRPERREIPISQERVEFDTLEPLSMTIDRYLVDKDEVRTIDFDLEALHDSMEHVAVWAIVQIKGREPTLEDWSEVDFKSYCRDLPEEDLEWVDLIFANTATDPSRLAADDIQHQGLTQGCAAKLALDWSFTSQDAGRAWLTSGILMTAEVAGSEQGSLDVIFRERPIDPDDPKGDKELVPYGSVSYSGHGESGGSQEHPAMEMRGRGEAICSFSDRWRGDPSSPKGATLRLKVVRPETEEPAERTLDEELSELPEGFRELLGEQGRMAEQLGEMLPALEQMADQVAPRPQPGQLQYKIRLTFDSVTCTHTYTVSSASARGGGTTTGTSTEELAVIMEPVVGGFAASDATVIPIEESVQIASGTAQIRGVLTLKKP